jgi:hypothetical protein
LKKIISGQQYAYRVATEETAAGMETDDVENEYDFEKKILNISGWKVDISYKERER